MYPFTSLVQPYSSTRYYYYYAVAYYSRAKRPPFGGILLFDFMFQDMAPRASNPNKKQVRAIEPQSDRLLRPSADLPSRVRRGRTCESTMSSGRKALSPAAALRRMSVLWRLNSSNTLLPVGWGRMHRIHVGSGSRRLPRTRLSICTKMIVSIYNVMHHAYG